MLNLRCSALPLIAACPQASRAPEVAIDSAGAPARLGSACHAATLSEGLDVGLSRTLGQNVCFQDLDAIAERFGVELDELRPLVAQTFKLLLRVKRFFPGPFVEHPVALMDRERSIYLTGHVDLFALVDQEIRILDLKTGWIDGDPRQQLRGYGRCLLEDIPQASGVYACQLRPRDGTLEGWRWTREELLSWWDGLKDDLAGEPKYNVGRHCTHCPRWAECAAAKEYTRGVMAHLGAEYDGELLSGAQALELYHQLKHAEALAERARDVLRACVAANGGELWHEENGLVITQQKRANILFEAGEAVLREKLKERFAEAIKVSKTTAEKIVADAAGKGMKQKAQQALLADLKDAGAVVYDEFEKLEAKRRQFDGKQFLPAKTA